jgi:hypothetical protein
MENQEEELTITGRDPDSKDYCCEWGVHHELKIPFRMNHSGISCPKDKSSTLGDMICSFADGGVEEALANDNRNIENYYDLFWEGIHPLELAMYKRFWEEDSWYQKRADRILFLLIKAGLQSDRVFRLALLQGRIDLIQAFCDAGMTPPNEAIELLLADDKAERILQLLPIQWMKGFSDRNLPSKMQLIEYGKSIERSVHQPSSDQIQKITELLVSCGAPLFDQQAFKIYDSCCTSKAKRSSSAKPDLNSKPL